MKKILALFQKLKLNVVLRFLNSILATILDKFKLRWPSLWAGLVSVATYLQFGEFHIDGAVHTLATLMAELGIGGNVVEIVMWVLVAITKPSTTAFLEPGKRTRRVRASKEIAKQLDGVRAEEHGL